LLETGNARNASWMVSVAQSLRSMHTSIGHEEGSQGDSLVAAVNVTGNDTVRDGVSE
jgi:hypothetical protein